MLKYIAKVFMIADEAKLISRIYDIHQLEIKILKMIDNYCEHEDDRNIET